MTSSSGDGEDSNKNDSSRSNSTTRKSSDTPPKDADNDCISCLGVSYLSYEMRKAKKPPACYGIRNKNARKFSILDMAALDELPAVQPNMWVMLIGYSRSSGRMNRTGKIPDSVFALEVRVTDDGQQRAKSKGASLGNTSSDVKPGPRPMSFLNMLYTLMERPEVVWNDIKTFDMEKGARAMDKMMKRMEVSMNKQLIGMRNTFSRTVDKLPQRMYR